MGRGRAIVAVVLALAATACAGDIDGSRGACDIREPEPYEESEGHIDFGDPLDDYFSASVAFARVTLDFEKRVRSGATKDFLVFNVTVDELLLESVDDPSLPSEFRVATFVEAEVCPDERLTRPEAQVVATFDTHTFHQPHAEWWLLTAWVDENGAAEHVSPYRPSPQDALADIYTVYNAAGLPAATETEQLLTWAKERRQFTLPRGAEESRLFGPLELALGRHHPGLGAFVFDWGGCGTTFATTDREERTAILVELLDEDLAASGEIPKLSDADGGLWKIEVLLGSDLMTGWRNDIVDQSTTRIDHRWPTTGGQIEFFGPHDNGVAVIRISGLVVTPPVGAPYSFREIEIHHDCWNCTTA